VPFYAAWPYALQVVLSDAPESVVWYDVFVSTEGAWQAAYYRDTATEFQLALTALEEVA